MRTISPFTLSFPSAAVALACTVATAAAPATPVRVRAVVDAVHADSIDITATDGTHKTLQLAPDARLMAVSHTSVGDIKANTFIGSAAIPGPAGTLQALEVHVFPAGMKSGEGSYAWDLGSNSTMTNGTVGSVVVSKGRTITVSYPNGQKKIVIPPDVPIVRLEPGDRSLLVKGAHAVFFTKAQPDGSVLVTGGAIGKGDVVPPM
jgi:hypothetical protein